MNTLSGLQEWPHRMGVVPGGTVMLMADVTRMAWMLRRQGIPFTPALLLDHFLNALGPSGTLLVPTFNHDLVSGDAFDVRRSPTITGALGQAALGHPAFRRTGNALHSFAVAGAGAEEILAAKETSSFGPRSPFAFMRSHEATIVSIDLHVTYALTYIHHVEEVEAVPYRRWRELSIRYTDHEGRTNDRIFRLYAKQPGHMNSTARLEELLSEAGALRTGQLDGLSYTLVDVPALHAALERDIRLNKARSIHDFSWERWFRDRLRPILRGKERTRSDRALDDHAARTPR
jgi:aminoglycoside 3-N-acetyltransferase